jgi:hypothetical protein
MAMGNQHCSILSHSPLVILFHTRRKENNLKMQVGLTFTSPYEKIHTLMQELFWHWGRKEGISESYGPKENQKHHVPMSVSNIVKNWTRKNKSPCVIIFVVFCSLLLIHGEAGGEKAARQE